ncbi:MAG: NAD(P)H-dependent oxidoreductase, partial [Hyphomicrobiales bacterium]
MSAKILVFAGSMRDGSFNIKLADALTNALIELGAEVTHVCAKNYQLPIFNEDLEVPEKAIALAKLFEQSDGFVFVSPEYNASVTPLMKNTLDWVSVSGVSSSNSFGPYKDKMCFISSCSPG